MKMLTMMILVCATTAVANAQTRRQPKNLFGILPHSDYLQQKLNLTPAQKKRLQEIYFQTLSRERMLTMPSVLKKLGITDAQKKKMKAERGEGLKNLTRIARDRKGKSSREVLKLIRAEEARTHKAIEKVPTRAQMRVLDKMRGKPIDFDRILPRRPNV